MADDAGVAQQAGNIPHPESGDYRGVETGETGPEALPLPQDGQPGEPGLEPLEADLLEQADVVHDGVPPLVVVIGPVDLRLVAPPAAGGAVVAKARFHSRVLAVCRENDERIGRGRLSGVRAPEREDPTQAVKGVGSCSRNDSHVILVGPSR